MSKSVDKFVNTWYNKLRLDIAGKVINVKIKRTEDGNYLIDRKTLDELLTSWTEWNAAEIGGVDNWEFYGEHYDEYFQEDRERTGNDSYGVSESVDEWIAIIDNSEE